MMEPLVNKGILAMGPLPWLKKLVSFDTTSSRSNLDLIVAIEEWFHTHQLSVRLTYNTDRNKANLFATLPASDGSLNGGLILSGHTDVVPVATQMWDSDPFQAVLRDDCIFGRGTCDMKSFIAIALALLPTLQTMRRNKPLHFAFSYDEEVGCLGVPLLIADFKQNGIHPEACIVGEPTGSLPVIAHKGIQLFRCQIHGLAAHSSLVPKACNAIEHAAKLITWLRQLADSLKQGLTDPDYDVPFTSLTTNIISGGTAGNIVPAHCEFYFEFRHLPLQSPGALIKQIMQYVESELLPGMRNEHPMATVQIDQMGAVPAFVADNQLPLMQLARTISADNTIHKVSYATEAGLFQQAGMQTLLWGPGFIEQAHKPNEYISRKQFKQYEDFLRDFLQIYLTLER